MDITKRKEVLGVILDKAKVGERAPNFKGVTRENEAVTLENYKGEVILLSVFPDINTSVCDMQTRRFFAEADNYEGLRMLNISTNKVEDLQEWCAVSGLDVEMISDEGQDFGNTYGLLISDTGLLARSVFLIDKDGKLVYKEILTEITEEPNYEGVLELAKEYL